MSDGDLIYRRDAIDAMKEIDQALWGIDIERSTVPEYIEHHEQIKTVRAIVQDLIDKIKDKPSAQQWIPCSERLPEANGRYLVTRGLNACGAMWNRVYIINYSDLMGLKSEKIWWQGNVGKSDFERIDDVIAWMPLPEPWRGKEDDI